MEDLSRLTLRALLTMARERFGSAASALKTREELIAALSAPEAAEPAVLPARAPGDLVPPAPKAPSLPVVTRDFFRRRS